ncbi:MULTISPECIES: PilW family protein [unclassified Oceanobacter]|uniref:PilW family protein n=1 Tax=unclassified Oceanobacter TaxID=2620260 RepID=UPI002734791F|nr:MULTISPECIES: PilW family protein [unclassified Oceanobacter]MDP2608000.1 PilW family protein [Oceanobacter sp. 1_MG-2023]MDP2611338.1 PilW family protein [Oceanobacter sp. 2_MG-2023]
MKTLPIKQHGMTLIELMIAGIISIIIGLAVMQLMVGSNRASNRIDGMSQVQESARFTLTWLSKQVRHGGFNPDLFGEAIQPVADLCSDATLIPPAANADCNWESTDQAGDRLAIRRTFEDSTANTWDQTTCSGVDLAGAGVASGSVIVDVYWVALDTSGGTDDEYDDVLRCASYLENDAGSDTILGDGVQTIASGIESFQVLYTDPGAGNTNASRYVSADLATLADVTAVRIAILTKAFSDAARVDGTRSYLVLDADPITRTDNIPRQILETTVFFPNR